MMTAHKMATTFTAALALLAFAPAAQAEPARQPQPAGAHPAQVQPAQAQQQMPQQQTQAPAQPQTTISRQDVAAAAQDLATEAAKFQHALSQAPGYYRVVGNAGDFTQTAAAFHRLATTETTFLGVFDNYRTLARRYRILRAAFIRTHGKQPNAKLVKQWMKVANAYERLAVTMGLPISSQLFRGNLQLQQ